MRPLLSSEQMAAADAYTIEQLGVPGIQLMERAAEACVAAITEMVPSHEPIAVIAGHGNNGGDGLAISRRLIEAGYPVRTFLAMPDKAYTGDALTNYERLREMGGQIDPARGSFLQDDHFALIVDAVFGTGLNRAVHGELAEVLAKMNASPARKFAVDIPSGLAGSHGRLLGETVHADRTVTFHSLKLAHVLTPASAYCGEVSVADIGIKRPAEATCSNYFLDHEDFQRPPRDPNSHKGTFGTLGILGGFAGMEGAANLCAMAALRFGVGKVRVYTNNRNRFHHDSVMVSNINHFRPQYDALVIGPGLSRAEEAYAHLRRLALENERILWDADGIYYLKRHAPPCMGGEWVMTPHPGEAAELLECLAREVQQDRLGAVNQLGEKYPGGWIVLKGYRSVIRSPEGEIYVVGTGGPALAVAGSGDVLSGMIGSLMAQKHTMKRAVLLGCLRHGMAGDHWVSRHRDYSMLAEDIIEDLKY